MAEKTKEQLKKYIDENVDSNGEQLISGIIMNKALNDIVDSSEKGEKGDKGEKGEQCKYWL